MSVAVLHRGVDADRVAWRNIAECAERLTLMPGMTVAGTEEMERLRAAALRVSRREASRANADDDAWSALGALAGALTSADGLTDRTRYRMRRMAEACAREAGHPPAPDTSRARAEVLTRLDPSRAHEEDR